MKLEMTIPTTPLPQARPRFGHGRAYEDSRSRKYKAEIAAVAMQAIADGSPMTGALKIAARFYKNVKTTSRRFGDVDNLLKALFDGLNGVVFSDDSAIVEVTAAKFKSTKPRIEVEIEGIDSNG